MSALCPVRLHPDRPVVLLTRHGNLLVGEVGFYDSLAANLTALGFQLVIGSYYHPVLRELKVPSLPLWSRPHPLGDTGVVEPNDDAVLIRRVQQRDKQWQVTQTSLLEERSIRAWHVWLHRLVDELNPALAIIWNGEHPAELLLREVFEKSAVPVWRLERGFVQGFFHFDSAGILAGSTLGSDSQRSVAHDDSRYASWCQHLNTTGATWYAQPGPGGGTPRAIRRLASGRCLILLTEQLRGDTQSFLFSPHFADTVEALSWLLQQVPEDRYFFVVKAHPLSDIPPQAYEQTLGASRGIWTNQLDMATALELCDLFATINSTTAYEALLAQKLPLLLGHSILDHKGIAYHAVRDKPIQDWLDQSDRERRLARWRSFFCYALEQEFIPLLDVPSSMPTQTVHNLARRLVSAGRPNGGPRDVLWPASVPAFVLSELLEIRTRLDHLEKSTSLNLLRSVAEYWQKIRSIFGLRRRSSP